jgi:hypothetical protein
MKNIRNNVDLVSMRLKYQTIKHVIMFCELMHDKNSMLNDVDIIDYH